MSDRFRLDGKKALVTGASRGIGRAIAVGLAQAGADVAVLSRDRTALAGTAAEIEGHGRAAQIVTCDVTDSERVHEAVAEVIGGLGGLDIVVNNAGGFHSAGPFLDLTPEDWESTLRLNLSSVAGLCRLVGPHLIKHAGGSVINVSSIAGTGGIPMLAPYAAAKAALISLSRTLAAEWAPHGVRVNVLAPGWITTDLTRAFSADQDLSARILSSVPSERWGDADEIAGAAVYLASDASRLVTGDCLVLDGGLTAYVGGPVMRELLSMGRIETNPS